MKAQIQKALFRFINHPEFFLIDGLAIDKPGGQAGKGLFVPGGQSQLLRELADLRLGQFRFPQGAFYPELFNRNQPGAIVAIVIHIGPLRNGGQPILPGNGPYLLKKLMLTEITAVFGILAESVDIQLLRLADDVPDPVLLAKHLRFLQFPLGERAGGGGHRKNLVPQLIVGNPQQEGGIHAAGKSDGHTAERAQIGTQVL